MTRICGTNDPPRLGAVKRAVFMKVRVGRHPLLHLCQEGKRRAMTAVAII